MDLVGAYIQRLALPENAARGLAGQLLGLIEDTVREQVSFGVAARIRHAVPEMTQWQLSAPTLRPGSLSLETLTPVSLDAQAELQSLLTRFHVPPEQAPLARSLALDFLASRLEASVMVSITRAVS